MLTGCSQSSESVTDEKNPEKVFVDGELRQLTDSEVQEIKDRVANYAKLEKSIVITDLNITSTDSALATITNNSETAIRTVLLTAKIFRDGRSVEDWKSDIQFQPVGGIEPGESIQAKGRIRDEVEIPLEEIGNGKSLKSALRMLSDANEDLIYIRDFYHSDLKQIESYK